jgi:pyruvate formate lyase activating enzyme
MHSVIPTGSTLIPTILATPTPDGSVRCGVCAHRCLVRPDRRGICGVRENRAGRLVSLAYGAVVAIGLDPIEKKPLFHVAPGSSAYSIATAGCPFHCVFCQNWEIAQGPHLGLDLPTRPLPPDRVVAQAMGLGAGSVAYTYVEPTVFLEYALDTALLARRAGLRNLFITDGYATPEAVDLLAPVLDAANVDLKSFDDAFYRKLCGGRLAPVLESIVAMRRAGIWLELTTLIIPGRNDDEGQLRALAGWIVETLGVETPWHVSRFFPAYRMPDVPPTPLATLRRAADLGREAGLVHVYVGNAPELGLEDTHCVGCDRPLIERRGYRVRTYLTADGACPGCGRALAGRDLGRSAAAARRSAIPCG